MRVVTLNTWKCDGDYPVRLGLMAQGLRIQEPDLVFLQECFSVVGGPWATASALAASMGFDFLEAQGREKKRRFLDDDGLSHSSLAILSSFALESIEALNLPGSSDDPDRKAQIARIPERGLWIVNVHLTHIDDDDALREDQLRYILDRLLDLGAVRDPVLLAGDFNADAMDPLFDVLQRWPGQVERSADRMVGPRATFLGPNPRKPDPMNRCLDQIILLRPDTPKPKRALMTARRVLDQIDRIRRIRPSDHAGVLAKVDL